MSSSANPQLARVLAQSQELGLIGPGGIQAHIDHAHGFAAAFNDRRAGEPSKVLDLGSGGGIPGLVLMDLWPDAHFGLLDGSEKRVEFLRWAIEELGATDRAQVLAGRAEDLAHVSKLRGAFDLAVARSFGPPPVLAECAAGFLGPQGLLIVSEPPDEPIEHRWPIEGVAMVGFGPPVGFVGGSHYATLELATVCPDRFPRRVGVPGKRPLF